MAVLNRKYYKGPDAYSDGAIEDELLELASEEQNFTAVLERDNRWPVLAHLSPERRNLLEWYPFRPEASLLEIGAGCGALTGLFSERLSEVTAAELSEKRCRIIERRYSQRNNITIMAGNFADMQFSSNFDYAVMIGVLEYARKLSNAPDPYRGLLKAASSVLKPDGVLLLAIENKFGLKYFAGARDDHTGRHFDGLEGYSSEGSAETFSRDELDCMLGQCGFAKRRFFYPHPDYKLPSEIFSDDFLPESETILAAAPNYDQERLGLFDERRAWQTIIRDGKFPMFANSFLVEASG